MKINRKTIIRAIMVLSVAVILSCCAPKATPEPTQDPGVIQTSAVQTIEVQFTQTALAMPTVTPPPTYTPVAFTPTSVPVIPTMPPALPTANPSGDGLNVIPANPVGLPSATVAAFIAPTATLQTAGDKASWESQNPPDNAHFTPGQVFDLTWYIKNTGTTTWTTSYSLRFFTQTNFAKAGNSRYYLKANTPPNEVAAITIDGVAPSAPGTYSMSWVLSNEQDVNFYVVDATIIVDK